MLESWNVAWPAALLLVLVAGYVLGWRLRQHGENERRRAIEAAADEFVAAAGRARDRERAERVDVETRLRRLRREHAACGERIARLESERDELREAAGHSVDAVAAAVVDDDGSRDGAAPDDPVAGVEPAHDPVVPAVAKRPLGSTRAPDGPPLTVRAWAAKSAPRAARLGDEGPGDGNGAPAEAAPEVKGNGSTGAPLDPAALGVSNGKPSWLLDAPRGSRDDLQAIRGVGPSIEKRLNQLGIFHYRQLADLGDDDVAWLGGQLGVFPDRVRRDRWREQARTLVRSRAQRAPRDRSPSRDA